MTDNVTANTSDSGGATFATDDATGVHWPYTKMAFGADNTQTIVGSISSNPFPVALSATDNAVLDTIALPVFADNAGFTLSTSSVSVQGGVYQNGTPGTLADNDVGAILLNSTAGQMVELMPSTAAIGKLAANSGVDIGDVDILSIAAGDNNIGNVDIASSVALDVSAATVTVDLGANNDVTIAAGVASIATAEDTASANLDVGVAAMARRTATPADTSGADLDYEMLQMDNGRLWTSATIDAALPAGTAAIGKLAANSGVDIGDVDILSIAAGDNNIGNVDIVSGTITAVTDITNTIDSTISGSALTALQLIDNPVVAHDAAISGATGVNVIGARAVASVEGQTETAAADASQVNATLSGNLITTPHVAPEELVNYHVVNTAGTELAVTGLDAGGATIYNYITRIVVHNAHATTMGFIQLLDGSAGTPFITIPAPATGGAVMNFDPPIKQPTVNTALYWDASAAITTLYVNIGGYQGQG